MIKNFTLFLFVFVFNFSFSQKEVNIVFSSEKAVFLNEQKLDNETTLKTIKSILGEPVIYKEYQTGKVNYHYTDLGLSLHFLNDKLLFIGVNFNWDGDKSFPKITFKGKLKIDNVEFDKSSGNSKLSEIKVVEFQCIMPELCMTSPKKEKNIIIIGFEKDIVTQIGFEFH